MHRPIPRPPARSSREQTRCAVLLWFQPSLPIKLTSAKDLVRVHPVHSHHTCDRSARLKRFLKKQLRA
jgi:hypothetical protein